MCEERGLPFEGLNKDGLVRALSEDVSDSNPLNIEDNDTSAAKPSETNGDEDPRDSVPQNQGNETIMMMKMMMEMQAKTIEALNLQGQRERGNAQHMGVKPTLPKFVEEDDIDVFLRTFENLAKLYQWPEEIWACQLVPLLSGKAREAYTRVSPDYVGNYNIVKEAILRRYDLTAEAYRAKFRDHYVKRDETYLEYSVQLTDLLSRWLEGANAAWDLNRLKQQILKEQMLTKVPYDLKVWLLDHEPDTLEEMARLADQYMTSRKTKSGGGKPGGYSPMRNVGAAQQIGGREDRSQYSSNGRGDRANQNKRYTQGNNRPQRCYKCDKLGHIAVNCPNKPSDSRERNEKNQRTYLCRTRTVERETHSGLTNYMSKAMLGGREIELLRDCGCTHSLARTDLVDPNLVIPGETLEIKGLLAGTVVSVARVYLISKPYGIAGWVKVGLLDVLPVDLILGNELVDDVELVIPQATNQAASLVVTRSKTREESAKAAKQEEEINKLGTKTTNLFEKEEANNEKGQGNKRDEKGGEIDSGEGSEREENIVDKDLPFFQVHRLIV
nr:uncharacterized protein LOC129272660 [Lytechinus pictus]